MGIEFEDNNLRRENFGETTPKMASWLISHGIVRDVNQANKVELGIALVFFALAIYFFFFF